MYPLSLYMANPYISFMLQNIRLILLALVLLVALSATAQITTTPVKLNEVTFTLPGTWEMINKREESGQYGFVEKQTHINISISARSPEKMEFFKPGLFWLQGNCANNEQS